MIILMFKYDGDLMGIGWDVIKNGSSGSTSGSGRVAVVSIEIFWDCEHFDTKHGKKKKKKKKKWQWHSGSGTVAPTLRSPESGRDRALLHRQIRRF
jgi:hypothetical protein